MGFRAEQRIALPFIWVIAIAIFGDYIIVSPQNKRLFMGQQGLRPLVEPLHKRKLVGIFFTLYWVAIGEINRGHPEARGETLDLARLVILLVSREFC